jgi:hypothetical protein
MLLQRRLVAGYGNAENSFFEPCAFSLSIEFSLHYRCQRLPPMRLTFAQRAIY